MIIRHFFDYEFAYIFLFCSMLFLICSILIKTAIITRLSIILFSIFFTLSICEFILSFYMDKAVLKDKFYVQDCPMGDDSHREISFYDNQGNKHRMSDQQIDGYDKKNISLYIYDFTFNRHNGFRNTQGNKNSLNSYVFLGDSFVFGDGLNDQETLPYYFSKLTNFENNVINCGIRGKSSNTAQSLLNSNLIRDITSGNVNHFVYSFITDSIDRNFQILENNLSDNWIYKDNKWVRTPQPFGKIKVIFARSYIFRKIFVRIIDRYNKRFYEDDFIKRLEQMEQTVKEQYNSKLTIIVWAESCGQYFLNKLNNTKLDLVYIPDEFYVFPYGLYRIAHDGHPTAKANEKIAAILFDHMKKQGFSN